MNGDYVISHTPGAKKEETFNTKYAEYDNDGVEYFDVYMGPITHRYGEVSPFLAAAAGRALFAQGEGAPTFYFVFN